MNNIDYQLLAAFADEFNHVQHAYIDIAGSMTAGTLLAQIAYWFKPNKDGTMKIKVCKDGIYWLVKGRADWMEEIRLTEYEYDGAIKLLKKRGFVETKVFKFNGIPTTHIRIISENVNAALQEWVDERRVNSEIGKNQKRDLENSQNGNREIPKSEIGKFPNSITENTTENTTENNNTPLTPQGDVPERANGGRPRAQPKTPSQEQLEHDFAIIYGIYPKKVGRTNAFLNYRQWVSAKGREVAGRRWRLTNKQIYLAVKNYVDQQEDRGTELKYYKGFDTLMGRQLLDYLVE